MSRFGDKRWIAGVDIGGTNLVVGLVPVEGGAPLALRTEPTLAEEGADAVVDRVARMIEGAIAETMASEGGSRESVAGVGVGSPGPLNRESGVVLNTPNLGWVDFPLRDLVSEATGLAATLDNDANCATYGEWWQGAGRGVDHLIGITLGTGIGGGIVMAGEVVHGASDAAGEIGHMSVELNGRRCKCGNYGCLEAYCSGPNIAERAREGLDGGAGSLLLGLARGDPARITAAIVYEAAVQGDPWANEVMADTAKILGAGIANLINLLNPEAIVVFGGVTRAGERLFVPLKAEARRRAFRSAYDACRILPAALPDTAGVIGAAGVFRRVTWGA